VAGLRVLSDLLFGLAPTDVVNLFSAALVLVLVALVATAIPARRAANVDPFGALRAE
jgi:ABC-type lipoprotein release transport system permease subunit